MKTENKVTDGRNGGRDNYRERGEIGNADARDENRENKITDVDAITQTSNVDAEVEDVAEGNTGNGDEHGYVSANNRRLN